MSLITVKATITPDARISSRDDHTPKPGVTFRPGSISAPTAVPGFLNPVYGPEKEALGVLAIEIELVPPATA
ncbi:MULTISPECIES: hypothetical protein [Nonomuraea]|uniref:Uncharacterized protein n=1 Tax=Nonomuraea ferruginea TaxID=46174 RepID=A0ABT4TB18_9ACTN|nr:hypothetical protein [Nonomuraea ferruginea]MDA0646703.1 hypothetical protein [Nonomuraea ferruginea]